MNFQDNKLEFGIAILAMVLVTGMLKALTGFNSRPVQQSEDITYEMPRPKSNDLVGEFSLGNREIERREINLKKNAAADADAVKKAAAAKKAADDAAKLAAAKKAAEKKSAQAKEQPKMTLRVIARAESGMSGDSGFHPTPILSGPSAIGANPDQAAAEPNSNGAATTRTASEWMALLTTQPTQANMQALVKAVETGEISDAAFENILDTMLKSKDANQNNTAFYGLKLDMTPQSFEFTVKEQPSMSTTEQTTANTYLSSYYTNHQQVLVQVMQGSDETSAVKAGQVVLAGIQGGSATTGGGTTTGGGVQATSLATWTPYFSTFQKLAQNNNDPSLEQVSQSILQSLGQQVAVAAAAYMNSY